MPCKAACALDCSLHHLHIAHLTACWSSAPPLPAEYCEPAVELLRENKRMLDKAIRDLDRERMGLQNQEKKLVAEIKKTAKQGQMVRPLQCWGRWLQSGFRQQQCSQDRSCVFLLPLKRAVQMLMPGLQNVINVCHAGRREGHGKIPCAESACCYKDVWPKVSAAGCVTAYCGASICLEMPHIHHLSSAFASEATCRVMQTCLTAHCDTITNIKACLNSQLRCCWRRRSSRRRRWQMQCAEPQRPWAP